MKKMKLKLTDLQVESFITNENENARKGTVQGFTEETRTKARECYPAPTENNCTQNDGSTCLANCHSQDSCTTLDQDWCDVPTGGGFSCAQGPYFECQNP